MNKLGTLLIACVATLSVAGCASPAANDASAKGETPAGSICINPARIQKQEILSDSQIRFEMDNGDVWINTLKNECHHLKFQGGFSWDVHGMQVCSNQQIITVLNAGNTCVLGEFSKAPT